MAYIRYIYYYGSPGIQPNYLKAELWYTKAASLKNEIAMRSLALMYHYGNEKMGKNYQTAQEWFERAALHGDVKSMYILGRYYIEGTNDIMDYTEAKKWYEKADEYRDLAKKNEKE